MKTMRLAFFLLAASLLTVNAKPVQRMLLTKGTYKIPAGSHHAVKADARCLDSEWEAPNPNNSFLSFSGSINVTRVRAGVTETKPLEEVAGSWVEAVGGGENSIGAIDHIVFKPVNPDPATSFEINISYDQGLPVAGVADAKVKDLANDFAAYKSAVEDLNGGLESVREKYGKESLASQFADDAVQSTLWRLRDDPDSAIEISTLQFDQIFGNCLETIGKVESDFGDGSLLIDLVSDSWSGAISDLQHGTVEDIRAIDETFRGALKDSARSIIEEFDSIRPIASDAGIPEGALELYWQGGLKKAELEFIGELAESPIKFDTESSVDTRFVRLEEDYDSVIMTFRTSDGNWKSEQFSDTDYAISNLLESGRNADEIVLISEQSSIFNAKTLFSKGIRFFETPEYAFRSPGNKPSLNSHVIVVASEDTATAGKLFENSDVAESVVRGTRKLKEARDERIHIVETREQYNAAIEAIPANEPYVILTHHGTESKILLDEEVSFDDIEPNATVFSCSTHSVGYFGMRTTGELNFENVVDTLLKIRSKKTIIPDQKIAANGDSQLQGDGPRGDFGREFFSELPPDGGGGPGNGAKVAGAAILLAGGGGLIFALEIADEEEEDADDEEEKDESQRSDGVGANLEANQNDKKGN